MKRDGDQTSVADDEHFRSTEHQPEPYYDMTINIQPVKQSCAIRPMQDGSTWFSSSVRSSEQWIHFSVTAKIHKTRNIEMRARIQRLLGTSFSAILNIENATPMRDVLFISQCTFIRAQRNRGIAHLPINTWQQKSHYPDPWYSFFGFNRFT